MRTSCRGRKWVSSGSMGFGQGPPSTTIGPHLQVGGGTHTGGLVSPQINARTGVRQVIQRQELRGQRELRGGAQQAHSGLARETSPHRPPPGELRS